MSTNIHGRMDFSADAATHNNRVFTDFVEEKIIFVGNLADVACIEPAFVKDTVQFPRVGNVGTIEVVIDGETGPGFL